jgi:hypothetical protein
MASMSNENSSLPIEYQLEYGTAVGNADLSDFVNQAKGFGVGSAHSGLAEKQPFGDILSNASSLFVNLGNS